MALSRKFLTAMGIEADKVDEIISAHAETVDGLKSERDSYKEKAEKFDQVQKDLAEANQKLEALDKEDSYKVKYDALKEDFEEYKKNAEAQKTKAAKVEALKELLKEIGVSEKRIDSVVKITDLDKVKLDKEGNISGKDDLKKSLTEEWSDFIVSNDTKGATTSTPPAKAKGTQKTKEEIMAITDTVERQKAMYENKELFIT